VGSFGPGWVSPQIGCTSAPASEPVGVGAFGDPEVAVGADHPARHVLGGMPAASPLSLGVDAAGSLRVAGGGRVRADGPVQLAPQPASAGAAEAAAAQPGVAAVERDLCLPGVLRRCAAIIGVGRTGPEMIAPIGSGQTSRGPDLIRLVDFWTRFTFRSAPAYWRHQDTFALNTARGLAGKARLCGNAFSAAATRLASADRTPRGPSPGWLGWGVQIVVHDRVGAGVVVEPPRRQVYDAARAPPVGSRCHRARYVVIRPTSRARQIAALRSWPGNARFLALFGAPELRGPWPLEV
jgi:hypothetical protein